MRARAVARYDRPKRRRFSVCCSGLHGSHAHTLPAPHFPSCPSADPKPHPLLSYQLLTRVHPWLPEPLRANISSHAGSVQHALAAVNLPGSNAVPPPVAVLSRPSKSGEGTIFTFTEPLSIAVGRGFLERHMHLLESTGLLEVLPGGAGGAGGALAAAVPAGAPSTAPPPGSGSSGSGANVSALKRARALGVVPAAATVAAAVAAAPAPQAPLGVDVPRLQAGLSSAGVFAVATRCLLVHSPAAPGGGGSGFIVPEGAASSVTTTAGGDKGGAPASVAVSAKPRRRANGAVRPSGAPRPSRRRVIGVPWTGEGLPQGRGDEKQIIVFHQGNVLRRVRGKGRGRGRAFKARWSTDSIEPLPAAWASLTAGMEGVPIVVDVELLPPLPPGVPLPAALLTFKQGRRHGGGGVRAAALLGAPTPDSPSAGRLRPSLNATRPAPGTASAPVAAAAAAGGDKPSASIAVTPSPTKAAPAAAGASASGSKGAASETPGKHQQAVTDATSAGGKKPAEAVKSDKKQ